MVCQPRTQAMGGLGDSALLEPCPAAVRISLWGRRNHTWKSPAIPAKVILDQAIASKAPNM